ncbi:GrpB family protein [Candidatus Daviesbacteria bacterium]|nr:GrpB family protein [Candidatus Daviesbacteria bacterium]
MKKYVFKAYNPIFPELFEKEKSRIKKVLGSSDRIEHVGSTAVLGLGGKGIIDIYIATQKNQMKVLSKKLQGLGYEYEPEGGSDERLFHRISLPDPAEEVRTYHVHVTFPESDEWIKAIKLRDYLRTHPQDAQKYAKAKKLAAAKANESRKTYLKIKSPILEEIIEKSLTFGRL